MEPEPFVVRFDGELDAGDTSFENDLLAAASSGARAVVVDMRRVSFVDSAVVRALVVAHRTLTSTGGWLRVVYTHHLIRRVIDLCGLSELLPQYSSIESALRGTVAALPATESALQQNRR
ncbi:MAG TPA: STAS domain-containing protein [Acidimicrobiales bacterium]|nr:STAS domain-containing protein [Acidimicrobiales bacterium]